MPYKQGQDVTAISWTPSEVDGQQSEQSRPNSAESSPQRRDRSEEESRVAACWNNSTRIENGCASDYAASTSEVTCGSIDRFLRGDDAANDAREKEIPKNVESVRLADDTTSFDVSNGTVKQKEKEKEKEEVWMNFDAFELDAFDEFYLRNANRVQCFMNKISNEENNCCFSKSKRKISMLVQRCRRLRSDKSEKSSIVQRCRPGNVLP